MNTHTQRWLTSIVAIPLLIVLIGKGPVWLFFLLLMFIAVIGLSEFFTMTAPRLPQSIRWIAYGMLVLFFIVVYMRQFLLTPIIFSLWTLVPLTFAMMRYSSSHALRHVDVSSAVMGPLYVGLPIAMLGMIIMQPRGRLWIFFLLVVIFACDTGAFYGGRSLGKHKLYEAVSPHKTWEGSVAGLVCSFMAAAVFHIFIPLHTQTLMLGSLVFALAVASQIGDLAESMLKRNHGVKDSGTILPGHGGVLDRIDGLLFSIPVLYGYITLMPLWA